ncbi:MAG: DISARM system SNF2-like helicase DrmD [Polyangiaceae bacterium]|nr:DISARM system SNF2-like helicase DrmD [Polyangiaceae bacterium]
MPAKSSPGADAGQERSAGALTRTAIPSVESTLATLGQPRILDLFRAFGVAAQSDGASKPDLVRHLARDLDRRLPALLRELSRDELRAVCRTHQLDAAARARSDLQARLLAAAGLDPRAATEPPPAPDPGHLPRKGQVVQARHRQWLVEETVPGGAGESPLVRLVCLDDDDPGRRLETLWDLELGARVVVPELQGLGAVTRLDPPDHFGAYLHTLKWNAVSAADATKFQAPFRAGIKLMAHQLTPLMKALELPRANLFIADDVGLGKTIEAGLVLQELLLRQQADFVLVVCPASVCLQWRDEMLRRFGLRFEVMTRQFIAWRRQERGYGVNPWATHNRFIVSHPLLRRPEYRDPLIERLGDRARKGLLILDEAHVAAPASASKYATDTDTTRAIRDLAPRFDNRLFLSATPHNGHSNSFSALLEILDPARFTRGAPVEGKKDLEPVMVRRLKRDLRQLGVEGDFPNRLLVELALRSAGGRWQLRTTAHDTDTGHDAAPEDRELDAAPPLELELAQKLARYTELCAPASGRGRLVFVHLQQRLLSSPEAFARSIDAHARGLEKQGGPRAAPDQRRLALGEDPDSHGVDDDTLAAEQDATLTAETRALPTPTEEARTLLGELRALAEQARRRPDGKLLALLDWIRRHQCPAAGLGPETKAGRAWTERRVLLFTEYAHTLRYVVDILGRALDATDDGEHRVGIFHGGMGDDARATIQRAFNAPPAESPLRILVATDAAREGLNLQAHCADLFHLDLPWNPSRLEQRNGRIDRTGQPAAEVRCHYFVYPDRAEDRILRTVVRKIATVQRELGSLGTVLLEQVEGLLEGGLRPEVEPRIERIGEGARTDTVSAELEDQRRDLTALDEEIRRAGSRLEESRKFLEVSPESLRGVVEIGLTLAGAGPLAPAGATSDHRPTFRLPPLGREWERTLDTLRGPREPDEPFWQWRERPPLPVTFHPAKLLTEEAEQLHLAHPFVRRLLDRFLAQGYSAHDLSRYAAVVAPGESVVRVVGYARLTLFGAGAARLHDEIVGLAAAWPSKAKDVKPYRDPATAARTKLQVEELLARGGKPVTAKLRQRILPDVPALFAALWPELEAEADAHGAEAKKGLGERARREADDLRGLLKKRQVVLEKTKDRLRQQELFTVQDKLQKRQVELDLLHLEDRRRSLAQELETEPEAIAALYEVRMTRLTPVGLVVAWPEAMT